MYNKILTQGPLTGQPYYFQLYPINLTIINKQCELPTPGTTYQFAVLKGATTSDKTKIPVEANFKNITDSWVMMLPKSVLNFYIPSYIKDRNPPFSFKIFQNEHNEQYDLGSYAIEVGPMVESFKKEGTTRFEFTSQFADDYELQYQIYVESSRVTLEKVVRQYKNQRSLKSPLRERKEQEPKSQTKKQKVAFTKDYKTENKPSNKTPQKDSLSEINIQTEQEQTIQVEVGEPAVEEVKPSNRRQYVPTAQEKSETGSMKSGPKNVPMIQTRFKELKNTQKEIKQTGSQIRGSSITEEVIVPKEVGMSQTKQKLLMGVFLLASMVFIWFAMHPNSKV